MPQNAVDRHVVGVDFGTLSGRALVVRVDDGAEVGSAVYAYPHGVVTGSLPGSGVGLGREWALQVPGDYLGVLRNAVPDALAAAGVPASSVVGIATDFTACTVLPTSVDGTPLCEYPGLDSRPHAYAKLWRHHAAQGQADRINELAAKRHEDWLQWYGGRISSEWEFAKALQVLEEDPEIYDQMERWVEAADWIVWQLTGTYVRNTCTAGYKGIRQDGHYPSEEFLSELHPAFANFVSEKLDQPLGQLGTRAGTLTNEASHWTGLPEGIAVAVGNVDAHVTAAAGNALAPGQMVAIMGTSTCHIMNAVVRRPVAGMCGVVDGGIVEGLYGYEAGQSGVGDILAHFVDSAVPSRYAEAAASDGITVHELLTRLASEQQPGAHGLIALDWHSGNRSVLVDHELSGVIVGLTLSSSPEDIYRALIEATAFGTRVIVQAFREAGVPVSEFVAAGGLIKNQFLMQLYADVLGMPISLITSDQGPALGSAIHAAVAAGEYPSVVSAAKAMGRKAIGVYQPDAKKSAVYDAMYAEYLLLHDYFGRGGNDVMHRLREIQAHVPTE